MKTSSSLTVLPAVAATFCIGLPAFGSVIGTDDASAGAYSDGWTDGSDGSTSGDAFQPWALSTATADGTFAGHFIASSSGADNDPNGGGDIDSGGVSFGMFGNPAGASAQSDRSFNGGALTPGQTVSIDIAVNFRDGNKGVSFFAGGSGEIFNLNVGGDDYVVNNAATGNGSIGDAYGADTRFNVSLAQTSASGGEWTISRSGDVSDLDTGTFNGAVDALRLYIDSAGGGGDQNTFYANNLAVVPEPASLALLGFGGLLIAGRRR